MNRRSLLRSLPFGLLAIPAAVKAEPVKSDDELWVETDCGLVVWDFDTDKPKYRCGTRYKFLRGSHALCPNCGSMKCIQNEERSKMHGIEVDHANRDKRKKVT